MAITHERFEQGMTYDAYKAQMTRNQDRFVANEQTVQLESGDVAYFQGLAAPLNVLVIAEDWCGDVINNLPVLGRLAAATGTLNVRVFLRDQNLDLIDQYLNQGQFRSIPVFVLFDGEFRELGHFIERPAKVTELQAQMRRDLFATDELLREFAPDISVAQLPEEARLRLTAASAAFREQIRPTADREVVRSLREIVERGHGGAAREVQR
jgi:Thioredoxin